MPGPRPGGRAAYGAVLATLVAVFVFAVAIGAGIGAVPIGPWAVVTTMLHQLGLPVTPDATGSELRILTGLRLPRVAVAAGAGAALGLAGCLLSGAFRNRLAEPATVGTAAGALLGASLVLVVGMGAMGVGAADRSSLGLLVRGVVAAVAALATTAVVWRAARTGASVAPAPLLLAGLAVNAMVGAAAALFLFLGPAGTQTAATLVVSWLFGGLLATAAPGSGWTLGLGLLAAVLVAVPVLRPLDLVLAGEEEAAAAGVDVARVRGLALMSTALATGFAVAFAGVIAFVGLLAPHVVRRWTGPGHSRLVPAAMCAGATILVLADAVGRFVAAPAELPAGVLTALVGAPALLVALRRDLREVAA